MTPDASRASRRPLVQLELAVFFSGVGDAVAAVAFPWIVLERTGSATAAGVVAAAAAVPMLVSSLLAGTIVDRCGRRSTGVLSVALSAVSVSAVVVVDLTVGLTIAWLAVLAAIGAVFDPVGLTARETLLPSAARAADVRLPTVNSIHEAVWGLAFLAGPGIGGLLVATVGGVGALAATIVAFVASALLLAVTRLPEPVRSGATMARGFWSDTREGLRFVWRDPLLRWLGVLAAVVVAVYLPVEGVLLPVYFEEQDAAQRLGFVLMAQSAGGVVGALSYGALERWLRPRPTFLVALVGTCAAILGMAFLPSYGLLLAFGALSGLFYGPIGPIMNLAMQARSPEAVRGRVVGILTSAGFAAGPIGYLIVGPLVDSVGVGPAFLGVAVALMAVALAAIPIRAFAALDALGGPLSPPGPRDDRERR